MDLTAVACSRWKHGVLLWNKGHVAQRGSIRPYIYLMNITEITKKTINLYPAKLIYLHFQQPLDMLEVVSRYRNPQPKVVEHYSSYSFHLWTNINKYWYLNSHFIPNNSYWIGK